MSWQAGNLTFVKLKAAAPPKDPLYHQTDNLTNQSQAKKLPSETS